MSKPKVIVGLSGGVDSAVAALLLQQQGYAVEALFMKNWEEDDTEEYCSAAEDLRDAQAVAQRLGIELHTVNFAVEYWDRVFELFLHEYRAGRTPNPDVLCNREIKFRAFLDHALTLGAARIATGHYARVEGESPVHLLKGLDGRKDQTYFLHLLDQSQLRHALFPLGELEKTEVRRIACEAGFANHQKRDSTGICFIGERRFRDFLARYLPAQPGEIRSRDDDTVLGQHQGLMYYTLGQRQGLGIGGLQGRAEQPWYVVEKDLERNRLIVAQGHDHPALFRSELQAGAIHWIAGEAPALPLRCTAKIRYRQPDQPCTVEACGQGARVRFEHAQRAVTPGQSVVFYKGEECLGGGVIRF